MRRAAEDRIASAARISIRRVTQQDDEDLTAIEEIARESFLATPFSASEELARPWSRLWSARFAGRPEVVGFLVGWHVADELHVLNVATTTSMRRRGVARALMDVALAYAIEERSRIVLLEVRRSNRAAIKLYRGFGFTALGVRPRYYSDNDEDAIEMILGLDPETGRVIPGRDEIRIDG